MFYLFCIESFLYDTVGCNLIEVEKLIRFDPYMCLGGFLEKLYSKDNLTEDFLWDFSSCYPQKSELFAAILLDKVPIR